MQSLSFCLEIGRECPKVVLAFGTEAGSLPDEESEEACKSFGIDERSSACCLAAFLEVEFVRPVEEPVAGAQPLEGLKRVFLCFPHRVSFLGQDDFTNAATLVVELAVVKGLTTMYGVNLNWPLMLTLIRSFAAS